MASRPFLKTPTSFKDSSVVGGIYDGGKEESYRIENRCLKTKLPHRLAPLALKRRLADIVDAVQAKEIRRMDGAVAARIDLLDEVPASARADKRRHVEIVAPAQKGDRAKTRHMGRVGRAIDVKMISAKPEAHAACAALAHGPALR
jgi:hypothetical protein